MDTSHRATNSSDSENPRSIPKEHTNIAETDYEFLEKYLEDALDGKKDDLALSVILQIPTRCLKMMFDLSSQGGKTGEQSKRNMAKKDQKRGRKEKQTAAPPCTVHKIEGSQGAIPSVLDVARDFDPIRSYQSSRYVTQQAYKRHTKPSVRPAHTKQSFSTISTSQSAEQTRLGHNSVQGPLHTRSEPIAGINDIAIEHTQLYDDSRAKTPMRTSSPPDRTEILSTSPTSLKEGQAEEDELVKRTGSAMLKRKRPIAMTEFAQALDSQRIKKTRTEDPPSRL